MLASSQAPCPTLNNPSVDEKLTERTADLVRFWQMSCDLMLVTHTDLRVKTVNPAWRQVLGWTEEDLLGMFILDLIHADDRQQVLGLAARLAQGQPLHDMNCRLRHRDGSYHWINWAAVPGEGFYHAVGRDVSEERERAQALLQAEDLLRHSQKMEAVGQLTGGLAHDFNNLLTGITTSLALLRQRVAQGRLAEVGRYLDAADGAASRAATLTHRLLAFARRQPLDPQPTNVNVLVEELIELIRQTLGTTIDFQFESERQPWTVCVDANQLESALLNLCINARDAMPEGGCLTIHTRNHRQLTPARSEGELAAGEYLCVSVVDTGSGMTAEVIKLAFDPFFTTKPVGEGTGLGLSMVYGFARQSGGQVLIDSTLGLGTCMQIYLPRASGA